jgi:predicted aspartyl protease
LIQQYTVQDGGSKRALIPVAFLLDDGTWETIMMQVDTAADISVLPYDAASRMRYLGEQKPLYVREVVGSLSAIQTTVRARIMGKEIDLPIVASVHIQDPLLGNASFLDNFTVILRPDGFEIKPA